MIISAFFYIAYSFQRNDRLLMSYSLKASYFGDIVILMCIVTQFITAAKLMFAGDFSMAIPWIRVAHAAFGSIVLLWLIGVLLKFFYLSKPKINILTLRCFYCLNLAIIVIYMIIIHDAITQSTWFNFL